jgi:hypothetical protein
MRLRYVLLPIMLIMLLALLSLAQKDDNVAYLNHFAGWFVDKAAVNIEGNIAIQGCNVKVMGEKGSRVNDTAKGNYTISGNNTDNIEKGSDPTPPPPPPPPPPKDKV